MVHGILQFTPSIAFRYVLHRCESRDIRCRESFWIHVKEGTAGACSLVRFPWRSPRRGFVVSPAGSRTSPSPRGVGREGGAPAADASPLPPPVISTGSRVVLLGSVDFSRRRRQRTARVAAIRTLHRTIQSVGATGGVYKGQGRSQRELMTRAY
ncbi:hypothetical protein AB3S75_042723 [Citrus x aurantiifolia]